LDQLAGGDAAFECQPLRLVSPSFLILHERARDYAAASSLPVYISIEHGALSYPRSRSSARVATPATSFSNEPRGSGISTSI
jgi:hypothetical protein